MAGRKEQRRCAGAETFVDIPSKKEKLLNFLHKIIEAALWALDGTASTG
jgi:hypothetical protein